METRQFHRILFILLTILAFGGLVLGFLYDRSGNVLNQQWLYARVFGVVPLLILGLLSIIKPDIAIDGLELLRLRWNRTKKDIRINGGILILISLLHIYNSWRIYILAIQHG